MKLAKTCFHHGFNRCYRSDFKTASIIFGALLFLASSDALGLDTSRTRPGANHLRAHRHAHRSMGSGVRVGVIEAGGGVDVAKTTIDNNGRLTQNLNFIGQGAGPYNADPGTAVVNSDHATRVADIIGSAHVPNTGVAPGSNLYVGSINNPTETVNTIDYLFRQYNVGQFNLSLGGTVGFLQDTKGHTGVATNLDGTPASVALTNNAFNFAGQTIPSSIHDVEIRLGITDGDTAPGNFDVGNLQLQLDGIPIGLLNGFGNGLISGRTLTFPVSSATSGNLITALGDNQLAATINRLNFPVAGGDDGNGGNTITPTDNFFQARLTLRQRNDNGANKQALALDWHMSNNDTLVVKSAGNTGGHSAQITTPGDFYNGITVGALTNNFQARAPFSAYLLDGEGGATQDRRGKPEIVAPGTNIATEFLNNTGGSGTSFAAPHVSGVVALLQAGTEQTPAILTLGTPGGRNHQAIKAIILNSARKRQINGPEANFPLAQDNAATAAQASDGNYLDGDSLRMGNWTTAPKTPSWTPTRWAYDGNKLTVTEPLDDELGTGALDAERALIQFDGGFHDPGFVPPIGWDRERSIPGMDDDYILDFGVAEGTFLTATLTWDALINRTDGDTNGFDFADTFSFAELFDLDLQVLRGDIVVAESRGDAGTRGNNVEHLHFPFPADGDPGDYRIRVKRFGTGSTSTNFALAWWTHAVPEPSGLILMAWVVALLSGQRSRIKGR